MTLRTLLLGATLGACALPALIRLGDTGLALLSRRKPIAHSPVQQAVVLYGVPAVIGVVIGAWW